MNVQNRFRSSDQLEQTATAYAPADEESSPPIDGRNVVVSHGIHHGRFPVGGMMVREARRILAPLINIDVEAVPVINGSPVQEDQVIGEEVSLLSFVKPSSIKG